MKGDSLLLGCIYRSASSSASSNDNITDLSNNVGEDKASHKVIIGTFTGEGFSGMMVVVFCLIHARLIIKSNVFELCG